MKLFIAGGTGFVGSAVVKELIDNGINVLGLARSKSSAGKLISWGAQPIYGSLTDLEVLSKAAAQSDATIHLGFNNDFHHFIKSGKVDQEAIQTMGQAIEGTKKPLVITYGTTGIRNYTQTEHMVSNKGLSKLVSPRKSKIVARQLINQGTNAFVVRLPPAVHGKGDRGFTKMMIDRAKEIHRAEYLGIGQHNWSAVHRLDAAHLFYLATMYGFENPLTDERIFNAVGDESIAMADIAGTIGKKLNVPLKLRYNPVSLGNTAFLNLMNCSASSTITQRTLGWSPKQSGLLADISSSAY